MRWRHTRAFLLSLAEPCGANRSAKLPNLPAPANQARAPRWPADQSCYRTRLGHRVGQQTNRVTVRISVEPDKLPVIVDSVDGRSAIRQYCVRIVNRGICARRDGIHKSVVEAIAVLIYTHHLTNIVHAQEHRIGRTRGFEVCESAAAVQKAFRYPAA